MNGLALMAVLVAGLCTAAFNVMFSIELGRTRHEALTWAAFAVALDVTKWTMLIIAARRWPSLNAVAAILIWLTATTYSFAAALGFAAATRAQRDVEVQTFREHQVAMQSAKRSPLWQSTFACTQISTRQARAYCDALETLEAKQPRSTNVAQANVLAELFSVPVHTAATLLSLYLAFTCEVVSALGLFAVVHSSPNPERKSSWQTLKLLLRRRRHRPITPPSSDSDGSSTSASPTSASKPSSNSSAGFWQKPKTWT